MTELKEKFWSELNEMLEGIARWERLVIRADVNEQVGEGKRCDGGVMDRFGLKERTLEVQMALDFVKGIELMVGNTYFHLLRPARQRDRAGTDV